MEENRSVLSVFKITIFLLILNNVQSDTWQWYEQPGRSYFDYGNLDSQSSTSRNNDAAAPRIAWDWPFNLQNRRKVTRHPSSSSNENEDDMLPNDKFIFPDTDAERDNQHKTPKLKISKAPACIGKTFCENVVEYPTQLLDEVIKSRYLGTYQSVDAMDITYRIDTAPTESLCLSNEHIVYPKTAENVNQQWLYVVNHPNFTQGVRIETCMKESDKCNLIAGFAEGYATTCKQKYIYRQLAAIVEDGSISHELFRFPSSCCCQIQFIGSSLRFNVKRSVGSRKMKDNLNTD